MSKTNRTNTAIDLPACITKATKAAAAQGRTIYIAATYFGYKMMAEQPRTEKWTEVTATGTVTFRDTYAEFKARHGVA